MNLRLVAAGPNPSDLLSPARLRWLAHEGEGWLPTGAQVWGRWKELLRSEREKIDQAAEKQRMEEARVRARAMLT